MIINILKILLNSVTVLVPLRCLRLACHGTVSQRAVQTRPVPRTRSRNDEIVATRADIATSPGEGKKIPCLQRVRPAI